MLPEERNNNTVGSLLKHDVCRYDKVRTDSRSGNPYAWCNRAPLGFRSMSGGSCDQQYQKELITNTEEFCAGFYKNNRLNFICCEREFIQAMVSVVGNFTSGAAPKYRDKDQKKLSFYKQLILY